jgi:hypothetical protein
MPVETDKTYTQLLYYGEGRIPEKDQRETKKHGDIELN